MAVMKKYNGNLEELRVHVEALRLMVQMRGGMEWLGFGGLLRMFTIR